MLSVAQPEPRVKRSEHREGRKTFARRNAVVDQGHLPEVLYC